MSKKLLSLDNFFRKKKSQFITFHGSWKE